MMRAAWKPVAIVGGLLLLLTFLLLQSKSPDLGLRARMHDALQAFELYDAELVRDILFARAGLLANYDSPAQTAQRLAHDLNLLRDESQAAAEPRARAMILQHVQALADAAQAKLRLVEHFKSDNALLRNSLVYLAHAQSTLRSRTDKGPPVAEQAGHLSHALLSFMQTPDADVANEIRAVLGRLGDGMPADRDVQSLVIHGRFVVATLPAVDTLLHDTMTAPTAARARALQEAVWQHADKVEATAQVFRVLLYLVAVTLLAYLSLQFFKLRVAAGQLRRTNADLGREMEQRRQAGLALQASEQRLRAITDSAKEAIVTADDAGNVVSWNAGATSMFGFARDEISGLPFIHLMPARDRDRHRQALAAWLETGQGGPRKGSVEFTGLRKDGTEFPIDMSLSSWLAQEARYVTGIMRDVTERKRLEEMARQQELQLIQANKMTALGTLVSGVAHEINNPNQLVLLNSRVVAEAWDDALDILDDCQDPHTGFTLGGLPYAEMRHTIPALVRDIHDGALRIERIVNDLKDFARPPSLATTAVFQLNDAVERALRLLRHLIDKRSARFGVHLAAGLPALRGDAAQIEQVIVNLVVNALEALPDRERAVSVSTWHDRERQCVVLEVRDQGTGIAQQHLSRLCDPFFTTKQASGGTGLGLAITASLLRSFGARLDFTSQPGHGTRAVAEFPVVDEPAVAAAS